MYNKEWFEKLKSDGLCRRCSPDNRQPIAPGSKILCEFHLKLSAEKAKNKCKRRKDEGKCYECESPAAHGKNMCLFHLEKRKVYFAERRTERRNKGLCEDCGAIGLGRTDVKISLCKVCYLKMIARKITGIKWEGLEEIFNKNPFCPYTGIKLEIGVNASLDHVIPKSRGGTDESSNLRFVYNDGAFDVNRMKGNMLPEEFVEAIKLINEKSS